MGKINETDNPENDELSLSWPIEIIFITSGVGTKIVVNDEASFSALVQKENIGKQGNINFSVEYDDRVYKAAPE